MLTNSDIASYFVSNKEKEIPEITNIELLPAYVQKLVTFYATQSYVKAIMTIGSLSSNTNDDRSDIDLVIVCDNNGIPPKDQRIDTIQYASNNKAVLDSVDLKIWTFGTADDFTIDNQEVCTQFFTVDYLEEKVDLTLKGFYTQIGMEHPLASLSSLLKAIVHIDKDGVHKHITGKIDPYPLQLQETILTNELGMRFPYYLNRLQTAAVRGDIPFADKMVHQAIDSAVYIVFAHFKRFPNGPKRLYEQLDEIMSEPSASQLKQHLSQLYKTSTTPETLPGKISTLKSIFTMLQNLEQT